MSNSTLDKLTQTQGTEHFRISTGGNIKPIPKEKRDELRAVIQKYFV